MKVSNNQKEDMNQNVDKTLLGMTGIVWCLIAGLGYGAQNVFAKLAFERGLQVSTFIFLRHITLVIGSYTTGKLIWGINFDLRIYPKESMILVFKRVLIGLVSKTMQYAAISYIPLTLSSCISFTTGPIFAALLAFILIRERLTLMETAAVSLGIIGTALLTMPQWFSFLGLDNDQIDQRLDGELKKYGSFTYFFGISIALGSSIIDQMIYFLIRQIGTSIPSTIIPYSTGLFISIVMIIYIGATSLFMPKTEADAGKDSWTAIGIACCGTTLGWIAIEFMVIGLRMSKSALATYAEQSGVIIPFIFDAIALKRPFLKTDWIAVGLIVSLEIVMAMRSLRKKGEQIKKSDDEFAQVVMEEESRAINDDSNQFNRRE